MFIEVDGGILLAISEIKRIGNPARDGRRAVVTADGDYFAAFSDADLAMLCKIWTARGTCRSPDLNSSICDALARTVDPPKSSAQIIHLNPR